MPTKPHATIDALYHVPENGKAEIVGDEIVRMSPAGFRHGRAALAIAISLREHERAHGGGRSVGDNVGFVVDLPGRKSFSPDAAWYTGRSDGLKFAEGAPAFAAEIRSEGDYGPEAETKLAAKRADYFAAGAQVVWDVDLLGDEVVRVYRASAPSTPTVYRRGETAEAEPAVPRWTMTVDALLE